MSCHKERRHAGTIQYGDIWFETNKAYWWFKYSIVRYNARIVAKGYAKKYGNYYEETLNIAVRMTTIRVLLPLTVTKN